MNSNGNGNGNDWDIWDALENAQAPQSVMFGQVEFDIWPCVLVKGQGKVLFDPAVHDVSQRRISVGITLTLLPDRNGVSRTIERKMIAESAEWARIVLPSINALGLGRPRELNGKWVKATLVPTGRKYTTHGETGAEITRDATTFKFLAFYDSEAECKAARECVIWRF